MSKLSFAFSLLVSHFTFHSIQAQPGETKTGTATILGRVTLKGEPARDVVVILYSSQTRTRPANAPRAKTDENGRFCFTNVAAGNYSISAVAPGYVSPGKTSFSLDGRKVVGGTLPDGYRFGVIALGTDQTSPFDKEVGVDARGRFVIEDLVPGEYEIVVITDHPNQIIRQRLSLAKKESLCRRRQSSASYSCG